jgi:SAM-dependent methyltransferase
MDLARAQQLFDQLYSKLSGYDIARSEKERLGRQDESTTYGEVVPSAFFEVMKAVNPREGEVFVDLGSGTGKATMLAAFAYPFSKVVGIELLPGLGDAAREVQRKYETELRPQLPPEYHRQEIQFIDGDFLEIDLTAADVVFAHGTCYPQELIAQLAEKLGELRSGARVIMVGHPLISPELTVLKMMQMKADWGTALAYAYQRR